MPRRAYLIQRKSRKFQEKGEVEGMAESGLNGPTMTREIGGTTYIVTSEYSKNATETAEQKMRRLILKEAEKVLKESK